MTCAAPHGGRVSEPPKIPAVPRVDADHWTLLRHRRVAQKGDVFTYYAPVASPHRLLANMACQPLNLLDIPDVFGTEYAELPAAHAVGSSSIHKTVM